MKKLVKTLCTLLILSVMISLFAACGAGNGKNETNNTQNTQGVQNTQAQSSMAPMDKVDLKLVVQGDTPPEQDEVVAEINKVSQDELNINLQVTYISSADYLTKIPLMAATGEEFDIYLQYYAQGITAVAKKQCLPLDELIDKYGPDLKEKIPQADFDDVTIDGKIYGIPSVYPHAEMGAGFLVRKDLRVKYDIPEIKDVATFEKFCDAIAKNEKGVLPIAKFPYYDSFYREWSNGNTPKKISGRLMIIDWTKKPYKVQSILDSDLCKYAREWGKKAVENGWMSNDAAIAKDTELFLAGKAASMSGDLFNISDRGSKIAANFPGAEVELAIIRPDLPFVNVDPNNNYAQISVTSKNPERAVMFLNWLHKDEKNYDLYMYGIEGKHYTLVDGKIKLPDGVTLANNPYAPTPWFSNYFPWNKANVSDPPAYQTALDFWNKMEPIQVPLKSFSWNADNVKTELAACQKVWSEMMGPCYNGVGTDNDFKRASTDLINAGINKLVEDCQKQLDAWCAANNIQ